MNVNAAVWIPRGKVEVCLRLCLRPWLGAFPPLQPRSPLDTRAGPNTFPFCTLFLSFSPPPPSRPTGHSVTHPHTRAKLPWPKPQTPLVPNRVNVLRSADSLSFALSLSTYRHTLLASFHSFLTSSVPLPIQPSFLIITITPHGHFRSFRSF